MVQKVVTMCDVCGAEGDTAVVALGARGKREAVDLCRDHYAAIVGPLVSALTEHGRPLPEDGPTEPALIPPSSPGRMLLPGEETPWVCLVCGQGSKSGQGLKQHYRNRHQLSYADLYGPDARCPLCGDTRMVDYGGLGTHASHHPEVPQATGVVGLFATAAQLGDPHGQVAEARARGKAADKGPKGPR